MSVALAEVGGGGQTAGGILGGSRRSGSTPGNAPVLSGRSDVSLQVDGGKQLLGSTETTRGGGRILLLLGLSGGFRWTSGCLVKVGGGLNWAVEVCVGSWLVG